MGIERLPERIAGPRLVLRRWVSDDVELLAGAVGRNVEHLRPWMPWVGREPLPEPERRALVEGWEQEWLGGRDVVMAVLLDGRVVGGTGLHRRRGPHDLEIGYWVDRYHLRRGIATEVAQVLTSVALSLPGIDLVEIHHDKANVASGRIPARLGYELVAESPKQISAPGEVGVDCTWQMTRKGWQAAQP